MFATGLSGKNVFEVVDVQDLETAVNHPSFGKLVYVGLILQIFSDALPSKNLAQTIKKSQLLEYKILLRRPGIYFFDVVLWESPKSGRVQHNVFVIARWPNVPPVASVGFAKINPGRNCVTIVRATNRDALFTSGIEEWMPLLAIKCF